MKASNRLRFWTKYGHQTTASVCVAIGAFGLLQFLWGLYVASLHPAVDFLVEYVLMYGTPLLLTAGLTGFVLPLVSLVRHFLFERPASLREARSCPRD